MARPGKGKKPEPASLDRAERFGSALRGFALGQLLFERRDLAVLSPPLWTLVDLRQDVAQAREEDTVSRHEGGIARELRDCQASLRSSEKGMMTMKTDTQLQQDVIAELKWEPSVNAAQIGVEVKGGVVTLTGHVNSYPEKWNAERAAQRVSGVKALAVEMDVTLPGSSKRNDADIARSAENVLEWTADLPRDSVNIMVEKGWITLSGEVDWEYQRQAAIRAVRFLLGVTGVSDQIAIKPKVSLSAVKSDIDAALKRRAIDDAQNISVKVEGGDVTLSGRVHSWSERELAEHAAWGTPGVRKVVDLITVAY
jgi:osmotically-inducible protein OsmY